MAETVTSVEYVNPHTGEKQNRTKITEGAATFTPSSYDATLTMNGTGQAGALATNAQKVYFGNLGATTEAIRVAFGTSSADAIANLTISAAAATTGFYIPAAADAGANAFQVLGVPELATHYAVANAVAADTQDVTVTQGV